MASNTIYVSIPQILTSCATLEARIAMLDQILNGMELAILTATTTGSFEEYKLDTGQTKSEIRYRDLSQLQKAYTGLFNFQQQLLNRLNYNRTGRQFRLVDGKNLPGRGPYYNGGLF